MPAVERFPVGAPCWADLWTSDVAGSRAFYSALFGWEAQEPSPEFGGYFMFTPTASPSPDAWGTWAGSEGRRHVEGLPVAPRTSPAVGRGRGHGAEIGRGRRARGRPREPEHGLHRSGRCPARGLATRHVPGVRPGGVNGRPQLVRAVHPRLRGRPRLLPHRLRLADRRRGGLRRVPLLDPARPRRSRRAAGGRDGRLRVPARGRPRPLVDLLGRRRRRRIRRERSGTWAAPWWTVRRTPPTGGWPRSPTRPARQFKLRAPPG